MKTLFASALALMFSMSVATSSYACGDEAGCKSKKTAQKECCKGKSAEKCAADHKAEKKSNKKVAKN